MFWSPKTFSSYHEGKLNTDLSAIPFEDRTWTTTDYIALWFSVFSSLSWILISTQLFSQGFLWWHNIIIIVASALLLSIISVLVGRIGAKYGLAFVTLSRTSFGVRGSMIIGTLRGIIACVNFGLFCWKGAVLLYLAVLSWNIGFDKIKNTFPANWPINTQLLICFFGTWILTVVIGIFGQRVLRVFLRVNAILMFVFILGFTVVVVSIVRQPGPLLNSYTPFVKNEQFEKTAQLINPFIGNIFLLWSTVITLVMSVSDFTRFSTSTQQQAIGQAISIPSAAFFFSSCGMILLSLFMYKFNVNSIPFTIASILGTVNDPVVTNFVCFFFYIAFIVSNLVINGVAGANSFANFLPSISYRIGFLFTAIIGVVCFPWAIQSSSEASYGVLFFTFLVSPILGVVLADYYLIGEEIVEVDELYFSNGRYWFFEGFNWRGFVSIFVGMVAVVPGILGVISTDQKFYDLKYYYQYSWFAGPVIAAVVYFIICRTCPAPLFGEDVIELSLQRHKSMTQYSDLESTPLSPAEKSEKARTNTYNSRKNSILSTKVNVD